MRDLPDEAEPYAIVKSDDGAWYVNINLDGSTDPADCTWHRILPAVADPYRSYSGGYGAGVVNRDDQGRDTITLRRGGALYWTWFDIDSPGNPNTVEDLSKLPKVDR